MDVDWDMQSVKSLIATEGPEAAVVAVRVGDRPKDNG